MKSFEAYDTEEGTLVVWNEIYVSRRRREVRMHVLCVCVCVCVVSVCVRGRWAISYLKKSSQNDSLEIQGAVQQAMQQQKMLTKTFNRLKQVEVRWSGRGSALRVQCTL